MRADSVEHKPNHDCATAVVPDRTLFSAFWWGQVRASVEEGNQPGDEKDDEANESNPHEDHREPRVRRIQGVSGLGEGKDRVESD